MTMAGRRRSALLKWLRGWIEAAPFVLALAAMLFVLGLVRAGLRGFDTSDPSEIVRRLGIGAAFSVILAVVLGLVVQLSVFAIGSISRRRNDKT
jgi:hypothetical protein